MLGAAGGPELTNGRARPHTKRLSSLLQTFYKFPLPGPLGAPTEGMGRRLGTQRPGKECDCSAVSLLR